MNDNTGKPIVLKVLEHIGHVRNGIYVEAGAHDGIDQSNTKYLNERLGWKGILVEPSRSAFDKLIVNRSNDICVHGCLVSSDYAEQVVWGDFDGGLMSSVEGKRLDSSRMNLKSAPAITLDKLFSDNGITRVDFISLDTEGYELEILKGIDFTRVIPRYFLIEIYSRDYEAIDTYMDSKGYVMIESISNYNKRDNPNWDGTHNDYLYGLKSASTTNKNKIL